MSIYSGFATRSLQQTYDNLVEDLIYVLQKRIVKFYKKQQADQQKFLEIISHIYSQMHTMEKSKYLDPKTSQTLVDFLNFMQQECTRIVKKKQHQQQLSIEPKISQLAIPQPKLAVPPFDQNKSAKLHDRDSLSISKDNQKSVGCIRHQFKIRIQKKNPFVLNPQQHDQAQTNVDTNKTKIQEFSDDRPQTNGHRRKSYSSNMAANKNVNQVLAEYIERNKKNYLRGYRKRQFPMNSRTFALSNQKRVDI